MNSNIKSGTDTLAKLLFKRRLIIPRHQRPYAWDDVHIKWLLDDIAYGIENQKPYHYLGPIMFIPMNNNEFEINDGQQRMVTITLICAYLLHEHFANTQDTLIVNRAMRILFNLCDMHNKQTEDVDALKPRVTLSKNDQPAYKLIISGKVNDSKNKQMNAAWKTIKDFFSDDKHTSMEFKKSFFGFMLDSLHVSWTELGNPDDAITSFVTQNTRGKSLAQIQLTCTHFYRCLRGDEARSEYIHDCFNKIRKRFNGNEGEFFNYTRCYAYCEYGHLSKDRFCLDLGKNVDNADKAYHFVRNLSDDSKLNTFENINKNPPSENDYRKLTSDAGKDHHRIKITDYLQDLYRYESVSNAIMFALICQYDNSALPEKNTVAKFVYKSSKLLASFVQRAAHSFPGSSFATSRYEKQVASLAKAITDQECRTADNFLSRLKDNLDIDSNITINELYQARMESISFRRKDTSVLNILIRISELEEGRETVIDRGQATLEHILPQSLMHFDKWDFNAEEHERYVNRLGNLTLLPKQSKFAKDDFNVDFPTKKKEYEKSRYAITKELSQEDKWNTKTIEKRQAKLAKKAAEVWNFNID